jgi:type II secretory pathway component PulC
MAKKQHQLDKLTDKLTEVLMQTIDHLPESDVPFGSVRLSKQEQIEQYMGVRDDPVAWQQIFEEQGLREGMKYARDMERLIREPEEVEDAISADDEGE